MSFADILRSPLPSAVSSTIIDTSYMESTGEECSGFGNECGTGNECGFGNECGKGCEGSEQEPISTPLIDNVPEEEVPDELTPEQNQRVDDTMNAVATPMLLAGELNEDQIKEFTESVDLDIAVAEGLVTERTIVRFDKHARKAQLFEVAVAACARENKDPLIKKLDTVYKMERRIKAKLRVKYRTQANRKVKEYLKRAKGSKSGILARIAAKLTGKK